MIEKKKKLPFMKKIYKIILEKKLDIYNKKLNVNYSNPVLNVFFFFIYE